MKNTAVISTRMRVFLLLYNEHWVYSKDIRDHLRHNYINMSSAGFYQMMASMEQEELVTKEREYCKAANCMVTKYRLKPKTTLIIRQMYLDLKDKDNDRD